MCEVILRKLEKSDVNLILNWENNTDNWEISDNDSPYSFEDIEELISSMNYHKGTTQMRFIIVFDGANVGAIDLFDIDYKEHTAYIGILIADLEYRRRGFGLSAIQLIENEAFSIGVSVVKAKIHSSNESSKQLFKKAGFEKSSCEKSINTKNHDYLDTEIFHKWVKK
jgi:diamine N-acetyltransferase